MKKSVDILEMVCVIVAIVTGFILHREVHHLFVYDDVAVWSVHEAVGLLLAVLVAIHCVQHKFWFKNYRKIPVRRKHATTIFLIVGILLLVSGVLLMCGSHSQFVSISHYVLGILFTLLSVAHVAKRRKLFNALLRS